MAVDEIQTGLPTDLSSQLMTTEKVYYFSFIAFNGGCGSSEKNENSWLALTDKRVIYKTKVAELKGKIQSLIERDGDLPFGKISFIEVPEAQGASGCSSQKVFHLSLSTSGGTIIIPLPTKEKSYEIRRIYTELSQNQ